MDGLLDGLIRLTLYALVVLTFLGPIEAFLHFRRWQAARRGEPHAYLATNDPLVAPVVALVGVGTIALVRLLS